jgi:enoyl-CoA hydratase
MADDPIQVSKEGPVTVVAISRPERRNALDSTSATALLRAFEQFEVDDSASVAVLTGSEGSFCAGADLRALAEGDRRPVRETGPGPMGPTWLELTKPVIAAIEGHAVAGGLELALWCDLRVAATDAVLGVYCRRFGVPLVDGGSIRVARLIGQSRALDLLLRPGEALSAAVALANEIAAFPQVCMRNDRRSMLDQWSLSEHDALANEARLGRSSIASGEAAEGAKRYTSGVGRHGATISAGDSS